MQRPLAAARRDSCPSAVPLPRGPDAQFATHLARFGSPRHLSMSRLARAHSHCSYLQDEAVSAHSPDGLPPDELRATLLDAESPPHRASCSSPDLRSPGIRRASTRRPRSCPRVPRVCTRSTPKSPAEWIRHSTSRRIVAHPAVVFGSTSNGFPRHCARRAAVHRLGSPKR